MRLVTVSEAARLYGVSTSTIKRWLKDGRLERVQPFGKGGALRVKWEDK